MFWPRAEDVVADGPVTAVGDPEWVVS
jgi:hypothetical protein